jgi:antitoxin FitA
VVTYSQGTGIIDIMAKRSTHPLIVRNLEEEVVHELRQRAARHGRSAEAEHREILRHALLPGKKRRSLKELLLEMPPVGEDADFERNPGRGRDRR